MSKLIEAAVTHFNSKAVRQLHIDEWNVTVYSKNLSLDDKSKWMARADGDTTDYLIYSVIFGLADEKGEPIFDVGDKVKLRRNVDPEIVSKLASFVLTPSAVTDQEREKN